MTGVFDRIRIGQAPPPANANAQVPPQSGAPTSPYFIYSTVPTPADSKAIAAMQTVSGANFTLTTGPTTSGVSLINIPPLVGPQYLDLGSARVIQYIGGANNSTASVNITVNGYEETVLSDGSLGPGRLLSETVAGPANLQTIVGKKAFRYIGPLPGGVKAAGNTVSSVSIGTTDNFGIPLILNDPGFGEFFWNGTQDTTSTHFTLPDTTSPATATTGDVRGTYAPPSASTGTRRLVCNIGINQPDTQVGVYGQPQNGAT